MNGIVRFELLKERETLRDEIAKLQEEIDILQMMLDKIEMEYDDINRKIAGSYKIHVARREGKLSTTGASNKSVIS